MSKSLHHSDDATDLGVVCDVILADWFNTGRDVFEIRQFRTELESHYRAAGKTVPTQIADPEKLVPTLRLLQARSHIVKPTRLVAIEWQFLRET